MFSSKEQPILDFRSVRLTHRPSLSAEYPKHSWKSEYPSCNERCDRAQGCCPPGFSGRCRRNRHCPPSRCGGPPAGRKIGPRPALIDHNINRLDALVGGTVVLEGVELSAVAAAVECRHPFGPATPSRSFATTPAETISRRLYKFRSLRISA
jgi:hypothetical protein